MKPVDNLKTGEGDFEGRRRTDITHSKVERAEIKKHRDQITINEGRMQTDTTSSSSFKKQPVQRNVVEDIVKKQKMRSNITLGDDTTILRTTNQMNYDTITTRKDQRVEKTTTDVTDTDRIRDGTIAITTMKVTTVLENEKDHTPIKQVIRKGGQTNVREEVIHKTTDSDFINRQNIVNEQYHVNEVNQNVVNKKFIVNQRDVNNLQSIESRKAMNQSQISLGDRNTTTTTHHTSQDNRVTGSNQVNGGSSMTKTSQHHQTSNIITNQNDQNVVNRSTNKQTHENVGRSGSTVRTTTTTTASGAHPVDQYPSGSRNTLVEHQVTTQTSPTRRQHQSTFELSENTRNVSSTDNSVSKNITSQTERTTTTATTQRGSTNQTTSINRGGDTEGNVVYERTIVTSTPKSTTRQQNYSSDVLNMSNIGSSSKITASTSQSDKINNQLHLRQHESASNNAAMSTSSTSSTSRFTKGSAHNNSTSSISSIIRDSPSPCPMHRSSITTTEQHRRDYVSSNGPDHGNQALHSQTSSNQQQQHHRKNVLTSSTDVNNSVFHRKANLSTNSNEALHSNSMSSTAAIQRKSISNLHDQAIYNNSSSDRKSYSSMHRQGKDTVSHSTSSSTVQSHHQQQHGGSVSHTHSSSHVTSGSGGGGVGSSGHSHTHSSSHVTSSNVGGGVGGGSSSHLKQSSSGTSAERAQKIVKKDNLSSSFGGEFYGKSESKAYGSFASGHQHHAIDRAAVNRRSNQSSISIGDGQNHSASVYRREYATVHSGPCPAAHIEKSTFTHTRDTKSHKFFKPTSHQ